MGLQISNLIDCSLCANYKDDSCTCRIVEIENTFNKIGKQYAQKCAEFINERIPVSAEVKKENALQFILAGESEFVLISGKTGVKLRYKLDKKVVTSESYKDQSEFIYWLNTSEKNGTMIYAGVLFFDTNSNSFKFGKGARGILQSTDIRVKSLIYVLNNLVNSNFSMNVTIMHVGKCGKCGKKLTDPSSILTGLGPVCAKSAGVPMIKG